MATTNFNLRGFRDFYPEDMAKIRTIFTTWRTVSEQFGFLEWDAPILETQELYKAKSGDEIVDQLYAFVDKGEREVAMRAEMTPSLARMLLKRLDTLPRPIKWYNIARCFRYERPSQGRLREFFQWNIDLLGDPQGIADAEVMACACESLKRFGLNPEHYQLRINDRTIAIQLFNALSIPTEKHAAIFTSMDKFHKVEKDVFVTMLREIPLESQTIDILLEYLSRTELDDAQAFAAKHSLEAFAELQPIFEYLTLMGFGASCFYAPSIVRGLAYYTGAVFEIYAISDTGLSRAIAGGGRYDHLLQVLGGATLPACGFGMGDVVLGLFLEELNALSTEVRHLDYYLVRFSDDELPMLIKLAHQLRGKGLRVDYTTRSQGMGKQMKKANQSNAKYVLIFAPDELNQGKIKQRNLIDGSEELIDLSQFM